MTLPLPLKVKSAINVVREPLNTFLYRAKKRLRRSAAAAFGRRLISMAFDGIAEKRMTNLLASVKKILPPVDPEQPPIIVFSPSTGVMIPTINTYFVLLAACRLRLQGHRVISLLCDSGMTDCVGNRKQGAAKRKICKTCTSKRRRQFGHFEERLVRFSGENHFATEGSLPDMPESVAAAVDFEFENTPIGRLVAPSMYAVKGQTTLKDDPQTLALFNSFIVSAINVQRVVRTLIEEQRPRAFLLFNGHYFPEAIVRELAQKKGIPVYTQETGFRPLSALFSDDLAPDAAINMPAGFSLSAEENRELDTYLERRSKGDVKMGGYDFWPQIADLDEELQEKLATFERRVAIFTNIPFDTTQVRANTIFESMFDWVGSTLTLADKFPDTAFIVRAHPNEYRQGSRWSKEPVGDYLEREDWTKRKNVFHISPRSHISSYGLLALADFCTTYNSTIGLESAMLGIPTVIGGNGKYGEAKFVKKFPDRAAYLDCLERLITEETGRLDPEEIEDARRLFFFMVFRRSLNFSPFINEIYVPRMFKETGTSTYLRRLTAQSLMDDPGGALSVVEKGILGGGPFHHSLERK